MKKLRITFIKTYPLVKPYLGEMILASVCMLLGSAAFQALPYLMKVLIDDILVNGLWKQLYWFGLAMLILVLLGNVFAFLTRYLFADFSEKITVDARQYLFEAFLQYELAFFQKKQLGDLLSRIRDDSGYLHSLFTFIIASVISNVFNIILVTYILFQMNPSLSIIVLCSVPFYILINIYFSKRLDIIVHKMRQELSSLMTFIYDIFSKILVVKNFSQESQQQNRFRDICKRMRTLSVQTESEGYLASSMTQSTIQVIGVIILFLGGISVLRGDFTIGGLIAFYTYLGNLFSPILSLTQSNIQLNQALVGIDRYFEYLDHPPHTEEFESGIAITPTGCIEFENLSFQYDTDVILNKMNLSITAKDKIAIVGKSGIGKTTVALLLKRFVDPTEGRILLDGYDLRELHLGDLRKAIGYLTQDPLLINGTIRENLFIDPEKNLSDEQIWSAIEMADLKEFVEQLPQQLDTVLENNGARLSGGQKQRLSIARVLIQNPPIVVFDEVFSHLDVETEGHIWKHLKIWLKDKTTIFITHTLWDPEYFDRLVLINGAVQTEGHYTEIKDTPFLQQILDNKTKIS